MSDLFNIYEDNLNITVDRIKKIIDTFNNLSKEKAEYAIKDANNCIKEADKLLKQMEIEISSQNVKSGNNLSMKLRDYANEFNSVKKQFLKQQEKYINKKSEEALILGSDEHEGDTGGQQKHKLIDNEESAFQYEKLERAKRTAIEVEGVSVQVMRQLDHQTGQMKDMQKKVGDMNQDIDKSDNLLSSMLKLQNRNKVIILGAIIIFTIILVFIILMKTL